MALTVVILRGRQKSNSTTVVGPCFISIAGLCLLFVVGGPTQVRAHNSTPKPLRPSTFKRYSYRHYPEAPMSFFFG